VGIILQDYMNVYSTDDIDGSSGSTTVPLEIISGRVAVHGILSTVVSPRIDTATAAQSRLYSLHPNATASILIKFGRLGSYYSTGVGYGMTRPNYVRPGGGRRYCGKLHNNIGNILYWRS